MLDPVSWKLHNGKVIKSYNGKEGDLTGCLRLIDQTRLPQEVVYIETDKIEVVYDCIKRLVVRGAPAIGCSAALGLAAAAQSFETAKNDEFLRQVREAADFLNGSRPTAVNLSWALARCVKRLENESAAEVKTLKKLLIEEGLAILEEDINLCKRIGQNGAKLLKDGMTVLTHCNAGALATGDYGTALSPVYTAHENGLKVKVFSDETRPLLQGSRLTAWELKAAGVDVTTICDNMAGQVMKEGRIDLVIVGADRIAANGDAANKIGTYSVAVLAAYHNIPFYVAAPYSTVDLSLPDGSGIPIEQRDPEEIKCGFGKQTAPDGINFYNPAFDVTPCSLITGIITERGILYPPFTEGLAALSPEN